jgi:E3 ubiquitin-protein ligase CHFR
MSATESDSDQADGAWGQLLRPDGTIALCLHRDEERIGRLETSSLVINHPKVSSLHARVTRTGPSIEDCSSNGLWLDGVKVGRGNSRILGPNAQLSFGVSPASAADNLRFSFVACSAGAPADTAAAASGSMQGGDSNVTRAEPVGPASAPAAAPAGAAVAGEAAPSGPAAPAGPSSDAGVSSDSIVQDITCGICQDVLYNAVALQPCLHSFCAGCACTWLKRKRECPQCRCKIKVRVRRGP